MRIVCVHLYAWSARFRAIWEILRYGFTTVPEVHVTHLTLPSVPDLLTALVSLVTESSTELDDRRRVVRALTEIAWPTRNAPPTTKDN